MNKPEVIDDFKLYILPACVRKDGTVDKIMRDEEWNNYTDGLCKDGYITEHQYSTWTHPWNDR